MNTFADALTSVEFTTRFGAIVTEVSFFIGDCCTHTVELYGAKAFAPFARVEFGLFHPRGLGQRMINLLARADLSIMDSLKNLLNLGRNW